MMQTKWIEIRDKATFIPALAILITGEDGYLARRAGFGGPCVQLVWFSQGKSFYDPYDWGNRTLSNAHKYLIDHWESVMDGDVVDVEFILGESTSIKVSEYAEELMMLLKLRG